ncbi:peptidase M23-like protein [Haloactinopolyspora alba]|uniref:Peptidase M23-like protein n=1 Tax=Haloactinopolyspora alba TaxID=648780 RepID=A0A2P8DN74_9ACTN|nr:M23 family metallopeptidase [Haloactinopolyspora alba]PSK98667.1 peptidase M23-like protein [Haloactinopolyspora alba]
MNISPGPRSSTGSPSEDDRGRSAPATWRTWLSHEPPTAFVGFGRPVLAPAAGTVVIAHDGEPDHAARRSQLALIPYALGQARRVRTGITAIAGNHVVVALEPGGPFVAVVHLSHGSVRVAPGDVLAAGDPVGDCGNSGNSTQPHVHVQVTDSTDWPNANGLPMAFGHHAGMPAESEIVDV